MCLYSHCICMYFTQKHYCCLAVDTFLIIPFPFIGSKYEQCMVTFKEEILNLVKFNPLCRQGTVDWMVLLYVSQFLLASMPFIGTSYMKVYTVYICMLMSVYIYAYSICTYGCLNCSVFYGLCFFGIHICWFIEMKFYSLDRLV